MSADQQPVAGPSGAATEPQSVDAPTKQADATIAPPIRTVVQPESIKIPLEARSIQIPTEYNAVFDTFYRWLDRLYRGASGGMTIDSYRSMKKLMEDTYTEFNRKHREFEVLIAMGGSGFDDQVELFRSHLLHVEDVYLVATTSISRRIRQYEDKLRPANSQLGAVTLSMPIDPANIANTWGEFDGNPLKWHGFISAFRAAVHNRNEIPPVNKFKYLLKALKGKASSAIGTWDITTENYGSAYERLLSLYDKKYPRVRAYIMEIQNLPTLRNTTAEGLQKLAHTTYEVTRQLKGLDIPTDSWDMWLVCVLHSKLDPDTCCEWELTRNDDDNPPLSKMLNFLERRAAAYSNLPTANIPNKSVWSKKVVPGASDASSSATGNTASASGISSTARTGESGAVKKRHMCYSCQQEHQVFECPKFLAFSFEQRKRYVSDKKLCVNCLRVGGHALDDCRFKGCFACPGNPKHNPLLCPNRELAKNPAAVITATVKRSNNGQNK